MDLIYYFAVGMCGLIAVINIMRAIRMFVAARRARIIKVCARSGIIIVAVLFAGLSALGFNRLSKANEQLRKAQLYERILAAVSPDDDRYQNVTIKNEALSSSADTERIEENIRILKKNYETYKFLALYSLLFAFFELTYIPGALLIFTEQGLLIHSFKFPEPIVAEINGDMIHINYKAVQLANFKKIKSFKATPKNMAVFGRFIVWEDPNAGNVQQTVQPPNTPIT